MEGGLQSTHNSQKKIKSEIMKQYQEGDIVHFIHHNVDTYGSIMQVIGRLLMILTDREEVVYKQPRELN